MTQRILAWIGGLSLMVFSAAGIFAWIQVKERVEIHLLPDATGPDPEQEALLLLAEDMKSLRADLDALSTGIEGGFQELYKGLDERAAEREQDVRRALAALEERGKGIEARLDALALAPSAEVAAVPATTPETAPSAAEEIPASVPEEKQGFLSFRLPTKGLSFDDAQEFAVLGELSRVGFDAKTTLHDFSAATNAVSGTFRTTLAHPEAGTAGSVVVQSVKLDSAEKDRDADMRSLLESGKFPDIRYEIESFEPTAVDAAKGTLAGKVHGRMTIRGTTHELSMGVRASLDASKRLLVEGDAPLKLSDYGIEAPNKLGLIVMEDEVKIWIALRARSTGRASAPSTPSTDPAKEPGDVR
jgi:polyisoprenoid-binding protein YceI